MPLTNIEYGSLASSSEMNANFQYLDNRISTVVQNNSETTATINSNIASINSSINLMSENTNTAIAGLNSSISSINSTIASNGLYVTTYQNGLSWYREWFSNSNKTTRVWLEQGGVFVNGGNYGRTVNLLKTFSNTNYNVFCQSNGAWIGGGYTNANAIYTKDTNKFSVYSDYGEDRQVAWMACGK